MKVPLFLLSILALGAIAAATRRADSPLVVHEWGTFLAMAGSDGVTLDGMYHEEHALPPFVHARSKEQLRMRSISLKGETPVIYFYTDRRQDVNVRVKFPKGIWTQWYPQASMVAPGLAATQPDAPRNGHICWNVQIRPPGDSSLTESLPAVPSDALWKYARQVDASYVVGSPNRDSAGTSEAERFIFYRGLGRADLPLQFSSADGGTVRLSSIPSGGLKHLFVIRVENGAASYRYIPSLSAEENVSGVLPSLNGGTDVATFSRRIGTDLSDRLEQCGLFRKEAEAMVNTWRRSYFESEGVRMLFVLPQEWTDSFIPLQVHPKPTRIVRVMVGRMELLTPERESQAESAVQNLTSSSAAERERAFDFLRSQGRYIEPVVNRVARSTKDLATRSACRRLMMTDFVTELRSAVHNAVDGSKVAEKPAEVRANLAALLRQLGYDQSAMEEARRAEQELSKLPVPKPSESDSRWYLRAYARAKEGLGDDRGAARYYEKLVSFGSLTSSCNGCHEAAGPRNMTFYRDWWAGKKYAVYVQKLGELDAAIAEQQRRLAMSSVKSAAQMKLAYLTAQRGDTQAASRMWSEIESGSK